MRKILGRLKYYAAAVLFVFTTSTVSMGVAFAQTLGPVNPSQTGDITICHAPNADANPYVRETVNQDAADNNLGNDHGNGDHYSHTGPVWNDTLKQNKTVWGDIIPPIIGETTGLNWTNEGQAIYYNGCNIPTPVEVPTVTFTEPTCTTNGFYTLVAREGVVYEDANGSVLAAGNHTVSPGQSVTINAYPASNAYVLTGQTQWNYTFTVPTGCAQPLPVTPIVTILNECGINADTYTLDPVAHVSYTVNGNAVAPGTYPTNGAASVQVNAIPDQGYVLSNPGAWPQALTFTNDPCDATPAEPDFVNANCEVANGFYTIPATTGVEYRVNGTATTAGTYPVTPPMAIEVEAVAASTDYQIVGTHYWAHTFTVPEGCGGGEVIPLAPNIVVTPSACVAALAATGSLTVAVTNPNAAPVQYTISLGMQTDKTITVAGGETVSVTFDGLTAGSYTVSVTGSDGTMARGSAIITTCETTPVTPTDPGSGGHILGTSIVRTTGGELVNTGVSTVVPTIVAFSLSLVAIGVSFGSRLRRIFSNRFRESTSRNL